MSESCVIPEIDIGALVTEGSSEEERRKVLEQIHAACKDIGFLSIVNHGVPQDLIDKMDRLGRQFFYLPKESKMSIAPNKWNPANSNVYRGYFPASVFGKEGLDIADMTRTTRSHPDCHMTEMNKFPEDFTDEQERVFAEYFTALHNLGVVLVKGVFEIFKADTNIVDEMFRRPDQLTTLRLNYYPQNEEGYDASEISAQDGVKLACETHTDSVIFTILFQDMVGGLQVQSPWNQEWHEVPCNRKAFVLNTGMALEWMTNGHYKATYHRVRLGTVERMSIPYFFEPVPDFVLNPKTLVPDEEPKFEPLTYMDYYVNIRAKKFKEYQR